MFSVPVFEAVRTLHVEPKQHDFSRAESCGEMRCLEPRITAPIYRVRIRVEPLTVSMSNPERTVLAARLFADTPPLTLE